MPSKRTTVRLTRRPSKSVPSAGALGRPSRPEVALAPWRPSILEHAEKLWENDYIPSFIKTLRNHGDLTTTVGSMMGTSTWNTHAGRDEEYDRKKLVRLAATVADLSRERSVRIVPFFVLARSISFMMQRVPVRVWNQDRRLRRLVSQPYCRKVLASHHPPRTTNHTHTPICMPIHMLTNVLGTYITMAAGVSKQQWLKPT